MHSTLSAEEPVLVVAEDEPLVRLFAADFLEEAGFKVFEACYADEALTLLQSRPDVKVLMTDVEMGRGKNGFELAWEVRKRWPGVIVLIVSGRAYPSPDDLPEGAVFIRKPYTPTNILRVIHDRIQRPDGAVPLTV
jgi:DNA-binding NtrC family response regulator